MICPCNVIITSRPVPGLILVYKFYFIWLPYLPLLMQRVEVAVSSSSCVYVFTSMLCLFVLYLFIVSL